MSFGTELAWSGAWWCSIIFPSSSYLTPSFPARPSGNTKPGGNVVLPHPGWNVNLNPQKHRIEDDHGHHEVADKRWQHKSLADTASDALSSWQVVAGHGMAHPYSLILRCFIQTLAVLHTSKIMKCLSWAQHKPSSWCRHCPRQGKISKKTNYFQKNICLLIVMKHLHEKVPSSFIPSTFSKALLLSALQLWSFSSSCMASSCRWLAKSFWWFHLIKSNALICFVS